MVLRLPPSLPPPVIECVAGHFPVGDEDAMRRAGDYWSDQAEQCREWSKYYDDKADQRHRIIRGRSGDQVEKGYRSLAKAFDAQARHCDTLAEQLYDGANNIEIQKWTVIGFAVILAWTLAHAAITFAVFPAGGAAEAAIAEMRTNTALRWAWAKMLQYLSGQSAKLAAERGLIRLAGKMALIGAAQGGGINAAIQLKQVADHHRREVDWKAAGIAAAAGGVGGGVGMAFGRWFGSRKVIPMTTALAERAGRTATRVAVQIAGTAALGAAGGVAGGLAGAAVSLGLSGEDLTFDKLVEGLLPAFTGGFVGAAAHGAAGIRTAAPAAAAEAPPVTPAENAPAATPLTDAVPEPRRQTADAAPASAPARPRPMPLEEFVALAGGDDNPARPTAPRVTVNKPDWNPGLRISLPDNVNPVKNVDFPASPPAEAKPVAPKTPEPQPTPLGDALAEHLADSGRKPADNENAPAAAHPADAEVGGTRPPAAVDQAHGGVGNRTAATSLAEATAGAGQARSHGESNSAHDGPGTPPEAEAGTAAGAIRSAEAEARPSEMRDPAEGESGDGHTTAKAESKQPVPADADAGRPAGEKTPVFDAEQIRAEQSDADQPEAGQTPKSQESAPATAVPDTVSSRSGEPEGSSGERPAAARQAAGKPTPGEVRPPAPTETATAGGPPRVSAPKSAAGERPPAVESTVKQSDRGTAARESEHGRAVDDAPVQQSKDHPEGSAARGRPDTESTGKEPGTVQGRSDDEGARQRADDVDPTENRGEPDPQHARTDEDGNPETGREHPDAGDGSTKALAEAYRAEADDILAEYGSRDWNNVSDRELQAMLFGGDEREAALAVIEIINRGEGKVLRWTQVMGMLVLRDGHVGRMQAGEGKTLVFQGAAALRAAQGKPVRVLTTLDTLALEAYNIGQKLFGKYGFDIRLMDPDNPCPPAAEDKATMCFGTLNSDGFGELRGNIAPGRIKMVDEVDEAIKGSVFILSEGAGNSASPEVAAQVRDAHGFLRKAVNAGLLSEADFARAAGTQEDHTTLTGNDRGKVERILGRELTGKIEKILGRTPSESEAHRIAMAATAEWRYHENDDYVLWHDPQLGPKYLTDEHGNPRVADGQRVLNPKSHKVFIIDQTTHKVMYDPETSTESRWNGGLAQAVEAKHGIQIRDDPASSKSVTVQELFSSEKCHEFTGLSGTTDNAYAELKQAGVDQIVEVPRFKELLLKGADPENDIIVSSLEEKHEAMADGVAEVHATGRPVEVICDRNSEVAAMSKKLTERGIDHVAIDAKWFLEQGTDAEANLLAIFKKAGEEGAVLVINRQGARGVDIPISTVPNEHGLTINDRGGLHVIQSSRSAIHHDIDVQGENRAARSGGEGSVQYYIDLSAPQYTRTAEAQITVIKYLAAEAQHKSAVAEHEAAVAEYNAAPNSQTQAKLAAAANSLEHSRKLLELATADAKGLVSKLQPSGIGHPTADPTSAHLPNAPPTARPEPAATPAPARSEHEPPEQPPRTAATPDASRTPAAVGTAGRTPAAGSSVGTSGAATAGLSGAAATAAAAGSAGATSSTPSATNGVGSPDTPTPTEQPHPASAHTRETKYPAKLEDSKPSAAPSGTSPETATHETPGSRHHAAADASGIPSAAGAAAAGTTRTNDTQHDSGRVATTTAENTGAAAPQADRQPSQPVTTVRNLGDHNTFRQLAEAVRTAGEQATPFTPVAQAIDATMHAHTATPATDAGELTDAARNTLQEGINRLTPEQRHLVADAAHRMQQGDDLTPGHTEAIALLSDQVRALGENAPLPELTETEARILGLIAEDVALEIICATMGMAPKALRGHIARAGMKLGTRGDVATMAAALSRGQLAIGTPDLSRPLSKVVAYGTLTTREVHVLELATVGLSPAAIAEQLAVTRADVDTALARAGRKLGADGLIPTVVQAVLQRAVAGAAPQVFAPRTIREPVADRAAGVADPVSAPESERFTKQAIAAELFETYDVEVLGLDKASISVATALSVRNAIVDAFDEDPSIRLDLVLVAPMAGTAGAVIWDAGGVAETPPVVMVLNENLFGAPEKFRTAMDRAVRTGRLLAPTGDPAYDAVSHEMSHLRDRAARLGDYAESVEARAFGFLYAHFAGLRQAGSLPRETRFDDWLGLLDGYSREKKASRDVDRLFAAFDTWLSNFDSRESLDAWLRDAGLSRREPLWGNRSHQTDTGDGWIDPEPLYNAWLRQLDADTRQRIVAGEHYTEDHAYRTPRAAEPALGDLPVFHPAEALAEANNAFGRSAPKDFTHPVYALQALLRGVPVAEVWRNAERRNALAAARAQNPGLVPVASGFRPSIAVDGRAAELAVAWRDMSAADHAGVARRAPAYLNPAGPQGFVLHELARLENEHRAAAASRRLPNRGPAQPGAPDEAAPNPAAAKARAHRTNRSLLPSELWTRLDRSGRRTIDPAAIDLGGPEQPPHLRFDDITAGDATQADLVEQRISELLAGWSDPDYVREIAAAVGASVRWGQGTISVTAALDDGPAHIDLVDITGDHSYVRVEWRLGPTPGPVERAAQAPVERSSEELDIERLLEMYGDGDADTAGLDLDLVLEAPEQTTAPSAAPAPFGVGSTRAALRARLRAEHPELGDVIDRVVLAVSELVTNADKHLRRYAAEHGLDPEGRLAVDVTGTGPDGKVFVTVANDIAPGTAVKLPSWTDDEQALDREGGRGSQLIIAESTVAVRHITFAEGKNSIEHSVEYHLTPPGADFAVAHSRGTIREDEPLPSVRQSVQDPAPGERQDNPGGPRIDPVAIDFGDAAESAGLEHLEALRDTVVALRYGTGADPVLGRVAGLLDELVAVRRGAPAAQERRQWLERLAEQVPGWLARRDEMTTAAREYEDGRTEGTSAVLEARLAAAQMRLGAALAAVSAVWDRLREAPIDTPPQPTDHLLPGELERLRDVSEAIFAEMTLAGIAADRVHQERPTENMRRYDTLRDMSELLEQLLAFGEQPDPARMSRARRILLLDHFRAVSDLLAANELRNEAVERVATAAQRQRRVDQAREGYHIADNAVRYIAQELGEPRHHADRAAPAQPTASIVWPGAHGQPHVATTPAEAPPPEQDSAKAGNTEAARRETEQDSSSTIADSRPDGAGTNSRRYAEANVRQENLGSVAAVSDRGPGHEQNEDDFALLTVTVGGEQYTAVILSDGTSRPSGGDRASAAATRAARAYIAEALRQTDRKGLPAPLEVVRGAVAAAQNAVLDVASEYPGRSGPACTIVVALLGAGKVTVDWVGDSRAYWVPLDGSAPVQLTHDDSNVQKAMDTFGWARESARHSPVGKGLAFSLGRSLDGLESHARTAEEVSGPGVIVVATDGMWEAIGPDDARPIGAVVREALAQSGGDPGAVSRALVRTAIEQGSDDDVTVITAPVPVSGTTATTPARTDIDTDAPDRSASQSNSSNGSTSPWRRAGDPDSRIDPVAIDFGDDEEAAAPGGTPWQRSEPSSQDTLRRAQRDDAAAFEELRKQYGRAVFATVLADLGVPATTVKPEFRPLVHVAQGLNRLVFEIAERHRWRVEGAAPLEWLHGIASNLVTAWFEMNATQRRHAAEGLSAMQRGDTVTVVQRGALDRLVQAGRRGLEAEGKHPSGSDTTAPSGSGLTNRQFMVLQLIATGMTAREIGEELGISAGTVGIYTTELRHVFGARTRSELVYLALSAGVLADSVPLGDESPATPTSEPTSRELQLLIRIANGDTSNDIAQDLDIDPRTVDARVAEVGRKLGARNRPSIVFAAVRDGHLELAAPDTRGTAVPHLSDRETDVLTRVANGDTSKDIARARGLSSTAVDEYLVRISSKLRVHNRAAMVAVALRRGLLPGLSPRRLGASDLTAAEVDLLDRVASGQTNADIANDLETTYGRVDVALARVREKLGARNRPESVAIAIRTGILPGQAEDFAPLTISATELRARYGLGVFRFVLSLLGMAPGGRRSGRAARTVQDAMAITDEVFRVCAMSPEDEIGRQLADTAQKITDDQWFRPLRAQILALLRSDGIAESDARYRRVADMGIVALRQYLDSLGPSQRWTFLEAADQLRSGQAAAALSGAAQNSLTRVAQAAPEPAPPPTKTLQPDEQSPTTAHFDLSAREIAVLAQIAQGLTTGQIATALSLTHRQVASVTHAIAAKLGTSAWAEMLEVARNAEIDLTTGAQVSEPTQETASGFDTFRTAVARVLADTTVDPGFEAVLVDSTSEQFTAAVRALSPEERHALRVLPTDRPLTRRPEVRPAVAAARQLVSTLARAHRILDHRLAQALSEATREQLEAALDRLTPQQSGIIRGVFTRRLSVETMVSLGYRDTASAEAFVVSAVRRLGRHLLDLPVTEPAQEGKSRAAAGPISATGPGPVGETAFQRGRREAEEERHAAASGVTEADIQLLDAVMTRLRRRQPTGAHTMPGNRQQGLWTRRGARNPWRRTERPTSEKRLPAEIASCLPWVIQLLRQLGLTEGDDPAPGDDKARDLERGIAGGLHKLAKPETAGSNPMTAVIDELRTDPTLDSVVFVVGQGDRAHAYFVTKNVEPDTGRITMQVFDQLVDGDRLRVRPYVDWKPTYTDPERIYVAYIESTSEGTLRARTPRHASEVDSAFAQQSITGPAETPEQRTGSTRPTGPTDSSPSGAPAERENSVDDTDIYREYTRTAGGPRHEAIHALTEAIRRGEIPTHPSAISDLSALTAREQQILQLLTERLSRAEMAELLHVTRSFVNNTVQRIVRKLGARSDAEAVAMTLSALDRIPTSATATAAEADPMYIVNPAHIAEALRLLPGLERKFTRAGLSDSRSEFAAAGADYLRTLITVAAYELSLGQHATARTHLSDAFDAGVALLNRLPGVTEIKNILGPLHRLRRDLIENPSSAEELTDTSATRRVLDRAVAYLHTLGHLASTEHAKSAAGRNDRGDLVTPADPRARVADDPLDSFLSELRRQGVDTDTFRAAADLVYRYLRTDPEWGVTLGQLAAHRTELEQDGTIAVLVYGNPEDGSAVFLDQVVGALGRDNVVVVTSGWDRTHGMATIAGATDKPQRIGMTEAERFRVIAEQTRAARRFIEEPHARNTAGNVKNSMPLLEKALGRKEITAAVLLSWPGHLRRAVDTTKLNYPALETLLAIAPDIPLETYLRFGHRSAVDDPKPPYEVLKAFLLEMKGLLERRMSATVAPLSILEAYRYVALSLSEDAGVTAANLSEEIEKKALYADTDAQVDAEIQWATRNAPVRGTSTADARCAVAELTFIRKHFGNTPVEVPDTETIAILENVGFHPRELAQYAHGQYVDYTSAAANTKPTPLEVLAADIGNTEKPTALALLTVEYPGSRDDRIGGHILTLSADDTGRLQLHELRRNPDNTLALDADGNTIEVIHPGQRAHDRLAELSREGAKVFAITYRANGESVNPLGRKHNWTNADWDAAPGPRTRIGQDRRGDDVTPARPDTDPLPRGMRRPLEGASPKGTGPAAPDDAAGATDRPSPSEPVKGPLEGGVSPEYAVATPVWPEMHQPRLVEKVRIHRAAAEALAYHAANVDAAPANTSPWGGDSTLLDGVDIAELAQTIEGLAAESARLESDSARAAEIQQIRHAWTAAYELWNLAHDPRSLPAASRVEALISYADAARHWLIALLDRNNAANRLAREHRTPDPTIAESNGESNAGRFDDSGEPTTDPDVPATPHRAAWSGNSLLIGTEHYTNPEFPQSKALIAMLREWVERTNGQPRVILTEGRIAPYADTIEESLSTQRGEMAVLAFLAHEHGIDIETAEEDQSAAVRGVVDRISERIRTEPSLAELFSDGTIQESLFLYYVLRQMPQGLRAQEGFRPDIEEHLRSAIELNRHLLPRIDGLHAEFHRLMARDYSQRGFSRTFREDDLAWLLTETVDMLTGAPVVSKVQHIAAATHQRRELHAARKFSHHMASGKAVCMLYGNAHLEFILPEMPAFAGRPIQELGAPPAAATTDLTSDEDRVQLSGEIASPPTVRATNQPTAYVPEPSRLAAELLSLGPSFEYVADLMRVAAGEQHGSDWIDSPDYWDWQLNWLAERGPRLSVLAAFSAAALEAETALGLRNTKGRSLILVQERPRTPGEMIFLCKYGTLRADEPDQPSGPDTAARASAIGLVQRELSLDELPQYLYLALVAARPVLQVDRDLTEKCLTPGEFQYFNPIPRDGLYGMNYPGCRDLLRQARAYYRARYAGDSLLRQIACRPVYDRFLNHWIEPHQLRHATQLRDRFHGTSSSPKNRIAHWFTSVVAEALAAPPDAAPEILDRALRGHLRQRAGGSAPVDDALWQFVSTTHELLAGDYDLGHYLHRRNHPEAEGYVRIVREAVLPRHSPAAIARVPLIANVIDAFPIDTVGRIPAESMWTKGFDHRPDGFSDNPTPAPASLTADEPRPITSESAPPASETPWRRHRSAASAAPGNPLSTEDALDLPRKKNRRRAPDPNAYHHRPDDGMPWDPVEAQPDPAAQSPRSRTNTGTPAAERSTPAPSTGDQNLPDVSTPGPIELSPALGRALRAAEADAQDVVTYAVQPAEALGLDATKLQQREPEAIARAVQALRIRQRRGFESVLRRLVADDALTELLDHQDAISELDARVRSLPRHLEAAKTYLDEVRTALAIMAVPELFAAAGVSPFIDDDGQVVEAIGYTPGGRVIVASPLRDQHALLDLQVPGFRRQAPKNGVSIEYWHVRIDDRGHLVVETISGAHPDPERTAHYYRDRDHVWWRKDLADERTFAEKCAEALASGESAREHLKGNTGDSTMSAGVCLVYYRNGFRHIEKKVRDIDQRDAEKLASITLADAGSRPAAVLGADEIVPGGSELVLLIEYVPGFDASNIFGDLEDAWRDFFHTPTGQRLGRGDALVRPWDRHESGSKNWRLQFGFIVRPIDNGNAYQDALPPGGFTLHYAKAVNGKIEWWKHYIPRAELMAVRERTLMSKAAYDRRNRAEWYQDVIDNLVQIEAHAWYNTPADNAEAVSTLTTLRDILAERLNLPGARNLPHPYDQLTPSDWRKVIASRYEHLRRFREMGFSADRMARDLDTLDKLTKLLLHAQMRQVTPDALDDSWVVDPESDTVGQTLTEVYLDGLAVRLADVEAAAQSVRRDAESHMAWAEGFGPESRNHA